MCDEELFKMERFQISFHLPGPLESSNRSSPIGYFAERIYGSRTSISFGDQVRQSSVPLLLRSSKVGIPHSYNVIYKQQTLGERQMTNEVSLFATFFGNLGKIRLDNDFVTDFCF